MHKILLFVMTSFSDKFDKKNSIYIPDQHIRRKYVPQIFINMLKCDKKKLLIPLILQGMGFQKTLKLIAALYMNLTLETFNPCFYSFNKNLNQIIYIELNTANIAPVHENFTFFQKYTIFCENIPKCCTSVKMSLNPIEYINDKLIISYCLRFFKPYSSKSI